MHRQKSQTTEITIINKIRLCKRFLISKLFQAKVRRLIGLEELNQKYKDKGLVIIGFPCNQFKEQDPEGDEQIEEFCQVNYGVSFQIMRKGDVNGANAQPIFEYLKAQAPTEEYKGLKAKATRALLKTLSKSVEKDSDILWNFTKFLISKDGETIKRFAPTTDPKDFEKDIEAMLA